MNKTLKIGDTVNWRGGFGRDASKKAKVIGIEINCKGKHGNKVGSTEWSNVNGIDSVIDLDNGSWCYGNQITQIR